MSNNDPKAGQFPSMTVLIPTLDEEKNLHSFSDGWKILRTIVGERVYG